MLMLLLVGWGDEYRVNDFLEDVVDDDDFCISTAGEWVVWRLILRVGGEFDEVWWWRLLLLEDNNNGGCGEEEEVLS